MTTPGVYRRESGGTLFLVHAYENEDYELAEVVSLFGFGTVARDGEELELTRRELRQLEVAAHAESFDHAEEFIRMCLEIAAQTLEPACERVVLVSVG